MTKQGTLMILLSFLLLYFNHMITTLTQAQSPTQAPAISPASQTHPMAEPPSEGPLVRALPHQALTAPTNVSKILEKAGGFSVFMRLLKSTSVIIQIENQLNVSNSLTIFAPTNGAFSALKAGTLNALSAEQKVQLVQYHILPQFVSFQNFQTLSNPIRTQASNTFDYPMNITVEGSWVNISTGIVNATILATIYEDNKQLAMYKLGKVLLPIGVFDPKPKPKPSKTTAAVAEPAPEPTVAVKPDELPASSLLAPAIAALLNDASGTLTVVANGVVLSVGFAAFCLIGF